jgi:hypothetical protein
MISKQERLKIPDVRAADSRQCSQFGFAAHKVNSLEIPLRCNDKPANPNNSCAK